MTKRLTNEEFISRSKLIHDFKYDYSMVNYVNSSTKVKIKCFEHDTIFLQIPYDHLNGRTACVACHRNSAKQTMMKKHGVEHPLQLSKFVHKREQTMLNIYGTTNILSIPEFIEKKKQTTINVLGVEHATQSPKIQEKIKQTNMRLYGVEHTLQADIFRAKGIQTSIKKYGVKNHTQKNFSENTLQKLNNCYWLTEQHHAKEKPLIQIANELSVGHSTICDYFKKHNIQVKHFKQSMGEKEVGNFIKYLGYDIDSNRRDIIYPYEIDIFIPKLKIAIEYNGEYWHNNTKQRDKLKYDMCKNQKIEMITIWDFEWYNQQEDIKEKITKVLKNRAPT